MEVKQKIKDIDEARRDIMVTERIWRFLHMKKLEWNMKRINDVIEKIIKDAGYQI